MVNIVRTTANDPNFVQLVSKLDAYLAVIDGEDHSFYHQFNTLTELKHVVVAYDNDIALGCGTFKIVDKDTVEIKRMYVETSARGKKVASKIVEALEAWAKEENYSMCILETGARMPDAVALYTKNGYKRIPNYGPYIDMKNSKCYKKSI